MPATWLSDTRSSYDTDASGYAEKVRGLLGESPYLRASLRLFAELVHGAAGGPVVDVGCGPGYVTSHLHDAGVDAFGIDLSPELIAIARRDYPDCRFEVGTMTDLELAEDSVAGVLAFWSVIHVPDQAVPGVFEQFRRVLRPGDRCSSAFTSVTRHDARPRATRVARSTLRVTTARRARSQTGFAMRGSRSRPNSSCGRTRPSRERSSLRAAPSDRATMTLDLYGHLFPDRLDDLADRMDSAACAPDLPRNDDGDDGPGKKPR